MLREYFLSGLLFEIARKWKFGDSRSLVLPMGLSLKGPILWSNAYPYAD